MAYMNQDKKAQIAAALKTAVPSGWKYSLGVRHHSTIVFTLRSAPVDVLGHITQLTASHEVVQPTNGHWDVNPYYLGTQFGGELLTTFENITAALNLNNHDRSDTQTDYFDVGHYVDINIGLWNKPFEVK